MEVAEWKNVKAIDLSNTLTTEKGQSQLSIDRPDIEVSFDRRGVIRATNCMHFYFPSHYYEYFSPRDPKKNPLDAIP